MKKIKIISFIVLVLIQVVFALYLISDRKKIHSEGVEYKFKCNNIYIYHAKKRINLYPLNLPSPYKEKIDKVENAPKKEKFIYLDLSNKFPCELKVGKDGYAEIVAYGKDAKKHHITLSANEYRNATLYFRIPLKLTYYPKNFDFKSAQKYLNNAYKKARNLYQARDKEAKAKGRKYIPSAYENPYHNTDVYLKVFNDKIVISKIVVDGVDLITFTKNKKSAQNNNAQKSSTL